MRAPEPSGPLPAAIYARISRDRQGEGLGVERQESDARELAERLGWDVVAVYVDNDVSAYSGAPRPQYRAMLDAVRAGDVRGIVAWHTDRLHRRPTELEEFISLAEERALQVQTVKAGDLNLSTPGGRMVARMLGAAARAEVDNTRDRIRRQKLQAAEAGRFRGGPRPFGYEPDGVTVRESEARMVREATTALLSGRTLASLSREWNEAGSTGTLGAAWTYNNLRDMLLRPRNAGLLARGLPGRKGRSTSEPDWSFEEDVVGVAAWPALVPPEQWRALVGLLSDPARRNNQTTATRWLGAGIYRCGRDGCGALLRAAPHGGTLGRKYERRFLYRCTAQAHLTISADPTDDHVRQVVAAAVRDPRVVAEMQPGSPHLAADREQRTNLAARLSAFESDYAAGRITGSQLQRATETVSAEIREVDARLAKALRRSSSSAVLRAADPGEAFLAASVDVQRAVMATVLRVEVLPQERRGAAWSSDRLLITSAGGDEDA